MATQAQIRASVKINRKKDAITLRVKKETGAEIRAAAEAAGQSLQGYILNAICEKRHGIMFFTDVRLRKGKSLVKILFICHGNMCRNL